MNRYYSLNDNIRFGITTHNPSGLTLQNADETPAWWVYEDDTDSSIINGSFTQRTGLIGTYRGSFHASGVSGFEVGKHYEVHASGKVGGYVGLAIVDSFVLDDIYSSNVVEVSGVQAHGAFAKENTLSALRVDLQSASGQFALNENIYYADIEYIKDGVNLQDEFVVSWFKNASIINSGSITNPAISAYNTTTGAALFENQKLSYASTSLSPLRYNKTTQLLASGEPYLIITSGVIDSANRVWKNVVGINVF